jgi:ribosomal-protein-alanine acetyltransferase
MELTVEDASVRHLHKLHEIEKKCFGKEAFTKRQIAHLLTDYNSLSLVAIVNSEIVGFITGAICFNRRALNGHILTIDVTPTFRRRGVGQRLLQEIERIFIERGAETCHLEVREDNVAAISLYRKSGYREIGRLENYYRNADGIYLKKIFS